MQQRVGITAIYVTHDQVEAMSISDEIVVMNAGRVEQRGTPHEIYARPANRFVADFIGKANFISATVLDKNTVEVAGVRLSMPEIAGHAPGSAVSAVIRPEAIRLSSEKGAFKGTVTRVMFLGNIAEYVIDLGETGSWIVDRANPAETSLHAVGDRVFLIPSENAVHILGASSAA